MAEVQMRSDKLMRRGMWIFVGGMTLTIGTYSCASNGGGGPFLLAWGPIVFGVVEFFRGLFMKNTSSDVAEVEQEEAPAVIDGKCPSCKTPFSTEKEYCGFCGRYLRA
jgi:hypothetical protein